jgi:hypothetical protein
MRLIAFLLLLSIFSSGICSAAHACPGFSPKKAAAAMSDECMKHMAGKDGSPSKPAPDSCNMSSCCHAWIGMKDFVISVPVSYSAQEGKPERLHYSLPFDTQFRPPRLFS